MLPPLKPLPMKDRVSMIFIQYGQIDVLDGAFVVIDKSGVLRWKVENAIPDARDLNEYRKALAEIS